MVDVNAPLQSTPKQFSAAEGREKQLELALTIGYDGFHLLTQMFTPAAPAYLRKLPVIDVMRRIWVQNYYQEEDQLVFVNGKTYHFNHEKPST